LKLLTNLLTTLFILALISLIAWLVAEIFRRLDFFLDRKAMDRQRKQGATSQNSEKNLIWGNKADFALPSHSDH